VLTNRLAGKSVSDLFASSVTARNQSTSYLPVCYKYPSDRSPAGAVISRGPLLLRWLGSWYDVVQIKSTSRTCVPWTWSDRGSSRDRRLCVHISINLPLMLNKTGHRHVSNSAEIGSF